MSEYSEKFVVKGGMLIAAIVGLDTKSTMDLDTTLRNLPLTEEQISAALSSICKIDLNDDVSFEIKSVAPIRKDDVYILGTTQEYDKEIFKEALKATAIHRGSLEKIADVNGIIEQISSSTDLNSMWMKYQKKFFCAKDITYENVIDILKTIVM